MPRWQGASRAPLRRAMFVRHLLAARAFSRHGQLLVLCPGHPDAGRSRRGLPADAARAQHGVVQSPDLLVRAALIGFSSFFSPPARPGESPPDAPPPLLA